MAVSLDLADPVNTLVDLYKANLSKTPHVVIPGPPTDYVRGGYDWGDGDPPRILPIEGEVRDAKWYPRAGYESIYDVPGQHEVYVFRVDENLLTETQTSDHKYADRITRLQTEVYTTGFLPLATDPTQNPRKKLKALFDELKTIIFISKTTPGGGWDEVDFLQALELSNRATNLFRITFDVQLKKISDFVGSA